MFRVSPAAGPERKDRMNDRAFFAPARDMTAAEIALLTGAELATPDKAENRISTLAAANVGGDEALIFVVGRRNVAMLDGVQASVLICDAEVAVHAADRMAVLVSDNPQRDFAMVARLLFPQASRPVPLTGESGISPAAHLHPDARLEDGVIIEAGAVIGPGVEIGSGTIIAPHAVLGPNCRIGREGYVGPSVTVQHAFLGDRVILHAGVRLGQDGFGYVAGRTGVEKVPQLGRVIVQNDVEIGANTTVDRGALGDTVIGESTKIDNLVQIAHNVRIGRACLIAGQCGLSGSVTLGDGVMLGGSVGVADHVTIGSGAAIAARSGVMGEVPPRGRWAGAPAKPMREFFREVSAIRRLAEGRSQGKEDDHG